MTGDQNKRGVFVFREDFEDDEMDDDNQPDWGDEEPEN